MPAPRRPKKVLIQMAVALVIAVLLGIGGVVMTINMISGVNTDAQKKQLALEAEKQRLAAEQEKLRQDAEAQKQRAAVVYTQVKAVVDIQPGQLITKSMLTLVDVKDRPPAGTLTKISDALDRIAKNPIVAGEVISKQQLMNQMAFKLKDGMRAITIRVDNVRSLGRSLTPGCRVDILATIAGASDEKGSGLTGFTRTILQNVEVLKVPYEPAEVNVAPPEPVQPVTYGPDGVPVAAAPQAQPAPRVESSSGGGEESGDPAITLAVTPRQAEMLALIHRVSNESFHLTMRNFTDRQIAKIPPIDAQEIITGLPKKHLDKPKPPKNYTDDGFHNVSNAGSQGGFPGFGNAQPVQKFNMEIYKGSEKETVEFQQ